MRSFASTKVHSARVIQLVAAANPRYHYGDRVKLKVVHVDYLLQSNRLSSPAACQPTECFELR